MFDFDLLKGVKNVFTPTPSAPTKDHISNFKTAISSVSFDSRLAILLKNKIDAR
jgi:hypothetical protein